MPPVDIRDLSPGRDRPGAERSRGALSGVRVPAGGRSDRFRPRTHALSGPEQQGNRFGEIQNFDQNHGFASISQFA